MSGIASVYNAERWWEGDIDFMDFVEIMLSLDTVFKKFHEDRTPKRS